ncbi:MAG: beta-galactosidase [Devosia sp.]|nr:beta-galactosidase [Devosia sp.]
MPLGIQYNRAPSPPEDEWARDLAHIRQLGLDHIYIWVMWCDVEREPGQYSFDAIERLVDLAALHGLDVVLNLEPWALPSWAERDAFRVVRLDGTPRPFQSSVIHSLHAGRPCLDKPGLRSLLEPFFRAAVSRFKGKPNLLVWKVWNEPDVDNCACAESSAKYQAWLKRKFGTLAAVSDHLKRHYRTWEDIRPPLLIGDTPAKLLYTEFRAWSATETASWAIEIVRDADPDHLILSDTRSTGTACLDLLADRMWNDWDLAPVPDIYGGHLHSAVGPRIVPRSTMRGLSSTSSASALRVATVPTGSGRPRSRAARRAPSEARACTRTCCRARCGSTCGRRLRMAPPRCPPGSSSPNALAPKRAAGVLCRWTGHQPIAARSSPPSSTTSGAMRPCGRMPVPLRRTPPSCSAPSPA